MMPFVAPEIFPAGLTTLSTQEWLHGLAITAGQILVVVALLRASYLLVRFVDKHPKQQ
ncbi:hypothetical protein GCM10023185_38130 [Hymenobacter saemangeumensis]|uniref:Uncharacterized protein n=1 Tax=Hymenobacter saemangeumensis TaxID=1084522 RepID=A0ABP8IQD9_9BACT